MPDGDSSTGMTDGDVFNSEGLISEGLISEGLIGYASAASAAANVEAMAATGLF